MSTDLFKAAGARRSIRAFTSEPVTVEQVESILEAGRRAPSAVNLQPTRVIVATTPQDLEVVRSAAYGVGACVTAPCVLVCMADLESDKRIGERVAELNECGALEPMNTKALVSGAGTPFELKIGREVALMNCAISVAHMDLQATHLGLGTCWVHHADFEQLADHYDLPHQIEIMTLLAIGHAAESPVPRPRIESIEWKKTVQRSRKQDGESTSSR